MTNRAKIEEIIYLTSEYNKNLQRQYELERSLSVLRCISDSEEDSEEEVAKKENERKAKENAVVDALLFRISAILETE